MSASSSPPAPSSAGPPMTVPDLRMTIGGRRVEAGDGAVMEVTNPYTGEQWATFPDATPDDVDAAVGAAGGALAGVWRDTTGYERARLLHRLADLLEEAAPHLGELETRDNGKLLRETTKQAGFAARVYRYYAGLADKILGSVIPLEDPLVFDYLTYEPMGVCALLTAWNSPLQLLANKLAPALAAGNTVVIKPSEHASTSTLAFAALIERAGFPPGIVNVVSGRGTRAGAALVEHPGVDLVSLTGGVDTGRAVASTAARNVTKVLLELGGRSPQVVFADGDLEAAVDGVVAGIFAAAGQSCIAGSRALVAADVYDRFLEMLEQRARAIRLGDPMHPDTQMGPLANAQQYERVTSYIREGRRAGVRLLNDGADAADDATGDGKGDGSGLFVGPTVFVDADHSLPIARDEIFGPVLAAWPFHDEAEAVTLANNSDLGLAAGVWTRDINRAFRMSRALTAGTVWVNTYRKVAPAAPFGGFRRSGVGRERGVVALYEYLQTKNVIIDTTGHRADPFTVRS